MFELHYWLDGLELQQAVGVGDEQGGLVCCSLWVKNRHDWVDELNWTEITLGSINILIILFSFPWTSDAFLLIYIFNFFPLIFYLSQSYSHSISAHTQDTGANAAEGMPTHWTPEPCLLAAWSFCRRSSVAVVWAPVSRAPVPTPHTLELLWLGRCPLHHCSRSGHVVRQLQAKDLHSCHKTTTD